MILRGIDRAHDIDLGPSSGTHSPNGTPGGTLIRVLPRRPHPERPKAAPRVVARCGAAMRQSDGPCARVAGHKPNGHRSQMALDNAAFRRRGSGW